MTTEELHLLSLDNLMEMLLNNLEREKEQKEVYEILKENKLKLIQEFGRRGLVVHKDLFNRHGL